MCPALEVVTWAATVENSRGKVVAIADMVDSVDIAGSVGRAVVVCTAGSADVAVVACMDSAAYLAGVVVFDAINVAVAVVIAYDLKPRRQTLQS